MTQRGQPQARAGEIRRAQNALSLYLTVLRNPLMTTDELCGAFAWQKRTLQRHAAYLRASSLLIWTQPPNPHWPSEWRASPPQGRVVDLKILHENTLRRWAEAIWFGGTVDLKPMENAEKILWYQDIIRLMLVGTPPFSPTDYINVDVRNRVLHFTVPKGRSINHPEVRRYKELAHA